MMLNPQLRLDNNEVNCTVDADPIEKTGRSHYWIWEPGQTQYRVCTTCGRREYIPKAKEIGGNKV